MNIPEEILERENKKLHLLLVKTAKLVAAHVARLVEYQRDEICHGCRKRVGCPEGKIYLELSEKIAGEIANRLFLMIGEVTGDMLTDEQREELRLSLEENDPKLKELRLTMEEVEKIKEAFEKREKESRGLYV